MLTRTSHRCTRRTIMRTPPRSLILFDARSQKTAQSRRLFASRLRLAAFDSLQLRRCYARGCGQMWLGQSAQDPPITRIAFIDRHHHDMLDRSAKRLHHGCEFVHLRGEGSRLPCVDGRRSDTRGASQIRHCHRGLSQRLESPWVKSAQDAPTHSMTSGITTLNHRALPSQDDNSVVIDSGSIPDYSTFSWPPKGLKGRGGVKNAALRFGLGGFEG